MKLQRLRDGLVDQFEIIVKQEIINHNNAILASNLAVNKLTEELRETKVMLESRIVKVENAMQALSQKHIDIENDIKTCKSSISNALVETKTVHERNSRLIYQIEDVCQQNITDFQQHMKCIDKFSESLSKLTNEVENFKQSVAREQEKLNLSCMQTIDKSKKEILETPNGVKELRDEIKRILEELKVEYQGIRRELTVCKKSDFIYEKMFEDVYMQLKMLKES